MFLQRLILRTPVSSRVSFVRNTENLQRRWVPRATYAASGGLTREVITSRILETLKGYEKIDPAKACFSSVAICKT